MQEPMQREGEVGSHAATLPVAMWDRFPAESGCCGDP